MTLDERKRTSLEAIERQILSIGPDRSTLAADKVDRLRDMVAAHADAVQLARLEAPALRAVAGRSAAAVAEHLAATVCPLVLARFCALLPIVAGDAPGRASGEASASDYADVIAGLFAWETAVGPDTRLRAAIQDGMSAVTRACRTRIERHLRVDSEDDFPDVRLLARDILRVEAVEWAVTVAGGASRAAELRQLAHGAARRAVQWAGRVFERFKAKPDEFTHFDAVATLSAVDDLLVVILRVLESDRDDRLAGSHPFVLTLGEQALQDFVDGLEHMTRRYLEIAEANLLSEGPAGAFTLSVLQLLRRVLRLGHALLGSVDILEIRLNQDATVKRMVALRDWLRASVEQPGTPKDHVARLAEIEAALADIGA